MTEVSKNQVLPIKLPQVLSAGIKKVPPKEETLLAADVKLKAQPAEDTFINKVNQVDLEALPDKFSEVEKQYSLKTGKDVKNSTELVVGYDFVRNHLQPYDLDTSTYNTGKEDQLMAKMRESIKTPGQKVHPEDLYAMSLELNDGDRFKSMVTVHDAIKMTGRGEQMGSEFITPDAMKAKVGEEFFNEYVQSHGGRYTPSMANEMGESYLSKNLASINGTDDTTGKYYHMFGTASGAVTGEMGKQATYLHAVAVNAKTNMDNQEKETSKQYGDGTFGKIMGKVARPVALVASGFGSFFGGYTTGNPAKWDADKTGVAIVNRLKTEDQYKIITGLDPIEG